jgi:hypothetical protein
LASGRKQNKMKDMGASSKTTAWQKNAVLVSDVLMCMIKDARYRNLLVKYLVDVSEAWRSMIRFPSEDPITNISLSYRIQPELELLAEILLYFCVNGMIQQRRASTLGMEFVHLEVDTSTAWDCKYPWFVYSVLRCLVPYVIQRVGRWDDDVLLRSFRGTTGAGSSSQMESLRGEERRLVFDHQRKRVQMFGNKAGSYLEQPIAQSTCYEQQQHRMPSSLHAKGIVSVYNIIKTKAFLLLQVNPILPFFMSWLFVRCLK